MAVTTTEAHVNIALYLKSKINSTYLGIGRSSEWDDEENPPVPTPDTQELDEPIGYKRVNTASLCRRLGQSEEASYPNVTYLGEEWELIPDNLAHEEEATYVYYEAEIQAGELPSGEYRQVGIFTNLIPEEGVNKLNLLPEEVAETGTLEFYENRRMMSRLPESNTIERFIVSTDI